MYVDSLNFNVVNRAMREISLSLFYKQPVYRQPALGM